jgi:hypothetical protein
MDKYTKYNTLHKKTEESKNFFENFILDIKNDLKNIRNFIEDNKKTLIWIFLIFVILQLINISRLSSVTNKCKRGLLLQLGGDKAGASYKPFQSFKTGGPFGDILGNFNSIFRNAFKLIGVIFLIAVIGFLPIIVLIVLTYKVLSYMTLRVRKF